jgi:hypothetical protein
MPREINYPDILLLKGSLEYGNQRKEIVSLDSVMKMENKFYSNVVKRLKKLKPNLILSC